MCVSFMRYTYALYTDRYCIHILYENQRVETKAPISLILHARLHPPGRDLTRTFHYLGQHCQIPYTQLRPFDTAMATAAAEIYSPGGEPPP